MTEKENRFQWMKSSMANKQSQYITIPAKHDHRILEALAILCHAVYSYDTVVSYYPLKSIPSNQYCCLRCHQTFGYEK